jgi:hypothetical protein
MGVRTAERMTGVSIEDLHMKYQYIGCGRVGPSYEEKQRHNAKISERALRCAHKKKPGRSAKSSETTQRRGRARPGRALLRQMEVS